MLSIDFFIALGALVFTLLIVLLSWRSLSEHGSSVSLQQDLEHLVQRSSVSLLTTQGMPPYWENASASSVESIGLLDGSGLLSMQKLHALNRTDMNASTKSRLLGVQGPGYGHYVEAYLDDALVFSYGNISVSSASYVAVREYMVYNGSDPLTIRMGVWR